MQGRKHPVVSIDENGKGFRYSSIKEAAEFENFCASRISRACQTGRKYKGFYWEYEEEFLANGGTL